VVSVRRSSSATGCCSVRRVRIICFSDRSVNVSFNRSVIPNEWNVTRVGESVTEQAFIAGQRLFTLDFYWGSFYIRDVSALGDCVMVARQTLDLLVRVRILLPQNVLFVV
jgi:hypothetical protein